MKIQPGLSRTLDYFGKVAGALAFVVCLSLTGNSQAQEQSHQPPQQQAQGQQQSQDQGQQADQPQASPQQPQAQPKYPPQDADKPPYSKDRWPQNAPSNQAPDQPPPQPPQAQQPAQTQVQLPDKLTIPAGTFLLIRMNDFLSSDRNQIGDQFTAVLEQPVVVNGWVVARRGQTLVGQVKLAQKAGRVKGVSQLGLELTDLTVVSGQQMPILTELWKASAGTSHGQDANTIAGSTGLGAIIGAAADWGRGAAIGAGVGAVAGIGVVLLTRGRPTEIVPETPLSFRLVDPVTVDTTTARMAFLPVTQEDYDHGERRPRLARDYPGPGPWRGPCGYDGPCCPPPFCIVY